MGFAPGSHWLRSRRFRYSSGVSTSARIPEAETGTATTRFGVSLDYAASAPVTRYRQQLLSVVAGEDHRVASAPFVDRKEDGGLSCLVESPAQQIDEAGADSGHVPQGDEKPPRHGVHCLDPGAQRSGHAGGEVVVRHDANGVRLQHRGDGFGLVTDHDDYFMQRRADQGFHHDFENRSVAPRQQQLVLRSHAARGAGRQDDG